MKCDIHIGRRGTGQVRLLQYIEGIFNHKNVESYRPMYCKKKGGGKAVFVCPSVVAYKTRGSNKPPWYVCITGF